MVKIQTVSATAGGPPVAPGTWSLVKRTGTPPRAVYQLVRYLRFAVDSHADRLVIVSKEPVVGEGLEAKTPPGHHREHAATRLNSKFQPLTYNVLAADPSVPAPSRSTSGNSVIIALDAPRQIRTIQLAANKTPVGAYSVELYRVDGKAPADKPTVTLNVASGSVATVPGDFDFTAVLFGILVKNTAGQEQNVGTQGIAAINVRSFPAAPRIGLALDGQAPTFFLQLPGEREKAVAPNPALSGNVAAHEDFVTGLTRLLNGLSTPLPVTVDVALIVEADAPCALDVTDFAITYRYALQSFLLDNVRQTEKQTLRFPSGRTTAHHAAFGLPPKADIAAATLKTVESFGSDRPASHSQSPTTDLAQKRGVHIGDERGAGQLFTPEQPITLSGISLALMALVEKTQILVEIREDWQGQPSGKKVADGKIAFITTGSREWIPLRFPAVVALQPQPYWIVLKPSSGSAVWLTEAGSPAVVVLERSTPIGPLEPRNTLDGIQALSQMLLRDGSPQPSRTLPSPTSVTLEKHPLTATPDKNGAKTYDLTAAMRQLLQKQPGHPPAITFTAATQGFITVYPPSIEYDLLP